MPNNTNEETICPLCGQYHRLQNLKLEDKEIFQGEEVTFLAYYDYCVFGRIETNQSGS